MLGKHGIGKIKAGMKIGPGNNNQKNPTLPKGKERKGKKGKGKRKWSQDGKGDGKDHFSNAAPESSTAATSLTKRIAALSFFTMHNFSSLFEKLRKRKRLMMFLNFSHT